MRGRQPDAHRFRAGRTLPAGRIILNDVEQALGAVLAMIGYGASAQVMIFFLPLYLGVTY